MHIPPKTPSDDTESLSEDQPLLTAAQFLKAVLPTWSDLSDIRRRDFASAIRCIARLCDLSPDAVMLECGFLNERLFRRSPAAFGVAPQTRFNALCSLRRILHRLGRHPARSHGARGLGQAWHALHVALPNYQRVALSGFMHYCDAQGTAPEAVTSRTLADYEAWRMTNTICCNPAARARQALAAWNKAGTDPLNGPATKLTRRAMRERYCLPLEAFPPAFLADGKRFEARLALSDPDQIFADDIFDTGPETSPGGRRSQVGKRRALRPRTIDGRRFQIRQAASALVHQGTPKETITSLQVLVDPVDHARKILTFFHERAGRKPKAQTAAIAELLRQIAKHHCGRPDTAVRQIAIWKARVTSEGRFGMTEKNSKRLRAVIEPTNYARLLHLPDRLMAQAEAPGRSPRAAAIHALRAVAIEMLLICPLRIANLQGLRLDRHLQRLGPGRRRITDIFIPGGEVKNGQDIAWPIPPQTARMLERYITHFRPRLAEAEDAFLFPGSGGRPRSFGALSCGISEPVSAEIGIAVNPHLLRHLAAWRYLKRCPGAYETVRQILGHRSINTTIAYYTGLEAEFAAIDFDAAVLAERRATRALATNAFRRRNPASAGRGAS